MIAIVIAEGIAIVLLALLIVGLLRGHAQILRTLHEAGLGDPAEDPKVGPQELPFGVQPGTAVLRENASHGRDVAGETPDGDAAALRIVGAEQDSLIAFLSSGCLTCQTFWQEFADGVKLPGRARLVIVTKGRGEESVSALRSLAPRGIPVIMSTESWEGYGIPMAPYFIYVDGRSGNVRGEGAASTWEQVDNLMRQGLADQDAGHNTTGRATGDGEFREARADRELMAAGIFPGDGSLYDQELPLSLDQIAGPREAGHTHEPGHDHRH